MHGIFDQLGQMLGRPDALGSRRGVDHQALEERRHLEGKVAALLLAEIRACGADEAGNAAAVVCSALAVGARLPNVSEWTANASIEYNTALSDRWDFSARADAQYIGSEFDPNAAPYPLSNRGGYSLVNMRFGVKGRSFAAYVFADNLLNKVALVGFDHSEAQNTVEYARVIPTVPRTVGVDLQYRF